MLFRSIQGMKTTDHQFEYFNAEYFNEYFNRLKRKDMIIDVDKFYKWLLKNIGERCPSYNWDCFTCRSWKLYDDMKSYVEFCEDLDVENKDARKHL